MIKRPVLSIALALGATLAMAVGASANTSF
jgi:hypothetical protein